MRANLLLCRLVLAFAVLALGACSTRPAVPLQTTPLILSTGAAGGTFMEYGNRLAQLLTQTSGVPVTSRASGGSLDNLRCLGAGTCDMALVAMAPAFEAWNGLQWAQGAPLRGYSAMLPMYETPFHLATIRDTGVTRFAQLAGRRVGVGPRGGANELIFKALSAHLQPAVELAYGSPAEMAEGVINGTIAAFFFGAGAPVPAYEQIARARPIVFLPIDGTAREAGRKAFPYLTVTSLPAGAYPGQASAVETLGLWNFLLVRDGVDARLVDAMTRATLRRQDLATVVHPTAVQTVPGNLQANTFLPVHPGAQKFYREVGALR